MVSAFIRGVVLIFPLAIVLAAGNILSQKKFITKEDVSTLSKLLFWIISPSLLFRNAFLIKDGFSEHMLFFAAVISAAFITMLFAYVSEKYLFRCRDAKDLALTTAASMRPNTIYVGLPTVQAVFGNEAIPMLSLYVAIAMPLYNLLSPLSSELILARGRNFKEFVTRALKAILKNPMVMAPLGGIVLTFCGLSKLPTAADKSLEMIGNAATGLALLTLGASIDISHAKKTLFTCWREVATRLFIHPGLLYFCMIIFGIEASLRNVAVLVTATPTAVTLFILARGIGLNGDRAAEITVITTLLSAVTIPIWITLLGI
ncbi:MAG: AEC family transporter [Cloacibacillus sp.]